jgi:alpha-tubulin suppressor-like RCC1 family protein
LWVSGLASLIFGVAACRDGSPADTAPSQFEGALKVSTNWGASCAVRQDGKVLCWGINGKILAVEVDGITAATDVSVGHSATCALLADGTVRCWGDEYGGQLGNGTSLIEYSPPVNVSGITSAAALSVGDGHACAVLADGRIQCWGANDFGQLGIGTQAESDVPSTVAGITGATGVSAGQYGTCAVLMDGTARCWGMNTFGRLGDGTMADSSVPVAVSGVTSAVGICTSIDHSCAVLADGTVQCWGANAFGETGSSAREGGSSMPVAVAGITDAVAVSCGTEHTCAVSKDGTIQCWGADGAAGGDYRVLGNPTAVTPDCTWEPDPPMPPLPTVSYETTCSPTPVRVSGITQAASVAAGYFGTCTVSTDGSIQCWGDNEFGQLGNGSTVDSTAPVTVMTKAGQ